jgi:hypothetical protein
MKWMSALLFCVVATGWTGIACADSSQKQVHTKKRQFAIPFQFDNAELSRLGTTEVRLYVSVDRGGTWQHVQSVAPRTRKFYVRAPRDGIYWFAVRTVGKDNQEHPAGNRIEPELKVTVDTAVPKLRIQLSQPEPGKVQLNWTATDNNINPSTITLESMQNGKKKWSKVFVSKKSQGTTIWRVAAGGVVEVRGEISDHAGNVGTGHDSKNIVAAQVKVPRQQVPDFNQPIASSVKIKNQNDIPEQFPRTAEREKPLLFSQNRSGDGPQIRPKNAASHPEENSRGRFVTIRKRTPTPVESNPVSTQQFATTKPVTRQPAIPSRIVNRRQFQIGYQIDKVGSSGVQSVELFITQNGGRKWYRYGTDDDQSSPFPVFVPKDGTYGFLIRVKSGAGLSAAAPQPGDRPSIVVAVDRTAPVLKLQPILQGTGTDTNRFLIRWSSADENPAEKPITISYALKPQGPWTSIISEKSNTGSHLWTVGPKVPPRVYIRLTARDKAGNISQIQTTRPIIVDLVRPSAKITEVNPITSPTSRR